MTQTPGLSITTTTLAGATTVGVGYAQPVAASGGEVRHTWSVSSGLQPGLANNRTGRRIVAVLCAVFGICAIAHAQSAVDDFNPGANGAVHALALQGDGKILVGGTFTMLGGGGTGTTPRHSIGRLNADGSLDTTFDPGADFGVEALAVQADGKILVGGYFQRMGGGGTGTTPRNGIGRLNADGSLDTSFDPGANNFSRIHALAVQADGKILVGGTFTTLGSGTGTSNICRLNTDGSLDSSFNPGANGGVNALAVQTDGKILVSGGFTRLGGGGTGTTTRNFIGRLNADGSLDTSFNPGANFFGSALTLQPDGMIVVGGAFGTLGGGGTGATPHIGIGRLSADGSPDASFNPGANSLVHAIAVQPDRKILVAGYFTTLGGGGAGATTRNYIGRINADGSLDTSFNPGANGGVITLAVQPDGKVLVGGGFTTLGGGGTGTTARHSIGRLNADVSSTVPAITKQPTSQAVTAGTSATFTVAASGTPAPTLQWQVSTNSGTTFTDLVNAAPHSGSTTATLTIDYAPSSFNGLLYRAVATNSVGSAMSSAATLTVTTHNTSPSVTTQPTSQTVTTGTSVAVAGAAPVIASVSPGVWTSGGPYGGYVRALAVNPTSPAVLYAGTNSGVFKSTDSGGTWAAANTGLTDLYVWSVMALAINPTTPSTLYAGTWQGGVFRSTDSGGSWVATNTGLTTLYIQALAVNPTTPSTLYAGTYDGGVFKSTDSGGTWAPANTGLTNLTVSALAIDPTTPDTLYAGTNAGVFKSTDSGGTWAAANTGLTSLNVYALAIDPTTPDTLYAGTYNGGVFKSTDSGGTWAAPNTGLTLIIQVYALAINPTTPATLYAGTYYGGIFKSTDSGRTWAAANMGLTNLHVGALAINPTTPATLYAGTYDGGIFKSIDSGSTWAAANTGLTYLDVAALAINPTAPATLYAGARGGVFKSTDFGGTWAAASTGLGTRSVYALAINPTTPATLYAGTNGGVFKSTDSGGTWAAANNGLTNLTVYALAIDPTTPANLYVGTSNGGVFKSIDSGGTWAAASTGLATPFVYALAINPATPATLYAGTYQGGIFKSIDSGATWVAANRGLPTGASGYPPNVWALAIDPATPATLYAGTDAYGGPVFKSTDSGGTWSVANIGLPSSLNLYACALAINRTTPTTLYVGMNDSNYHGGVFKSTDSGASWIAANTGLPNVVVNALALDPTGATTLYAGLQSQSVWRLGSPTIPPSSPTPLSPGGAIEGQTISTVTPTLQWTPGDGAISYAITISARPYGSNSVVYSNASALGTGLTLPPGVLVNGGSYRWEITAINDAGASVVSTSLYFQVLLSGVLPLPAPPVALSPGSGLGSGATLDTLTPTFRWTPSNGASTYGLRISVSPYGPSDVIVSNLAIVGTSFTLPGPVLAIGTQYRWNVTAINSGGESAASNSMYFVLRDSPSVLPAAPTGLTATWANGHARLAWADMSSNESGFKIERSDASGPYGQIDSTNQNTNLYTDTTASASVDHCYRVRATNGTGDSAYSNESCIARQGTATASQHLQFSSAAYTSAAAEALSYVTITRTGGSTGTVGVTVLVSQGTATAGVAGSIGGDYWSFGPVVVPFAPGQTSQTIKVLRVLLQPADDSTVNLALTAPTGDATLGTPSAAVMTIQGTGIRSPGTISIQDPVCIQGPAGTCNGDGLLSSRFPDPTKLSQLRSVYGAVADGVTLLVLSVNSSTPVTFSLARPSPQYGTLMPLDGSTSASSVTVTPVGSTAFALYQVPIDLTEEIWLGVTAANATGTVIANRTIDLRHPPVVFVHGIWADPSSFGTMGRQFSNLVVTYADYRYPHSADSFNRFSESVPIERLAFAVESALTIERSKGIAASQVDVVAHSMGGLVARAREKDDTGLRSKFQRKENRGYGEFHKLITIGTPHQGTPLADWLIENKCTMGTVPALEVSNHPVGPAVYDLQTGSDTLVKLGSTVVPTHAIVAKKPAGLTATETSLNALLQDGHLFETIDGILKTGRDDDVIVPLDSQRGGLQDGTTAKGVTDVIHMILFQSYGKYLDDVPETTSGDIVTLVSDALSASTSSGAFGSTSVSPPGPKRTNVPCSVLRLAATGSGLAPGIAISPAPGTIVRPGDVIQIEFSVPAASTSALISIGGQMTVVTASAGSFSTAYQLPPAVIGRIDISASTLDLGAGDLSGSTYVVALPSTPPSALSASPGLVDFAVQALTMPLTVTGTYQDGATADLTSSASGTTYSTQSGTNAFITVSAEGVVQAVANGQDTIIIQNGGQTASVTATVNITNQQPTLAALTDTTVVAGQTLDIPLTASDPDGNNLQLSGTGLPSFVTLVDNHNGTGVLSARPGATDVGTYPMFISVVDDGNPALGMSRSLRLTVNSSPPTITAQPLSQTIRSGQTATLSVGAAGTAPLTYQWYIGTSGTTMNPIGAVTSSSYTTPALTSTTSYWVRVSNSAGNRDSNTATITTTIYQPFTDDTLTIGLSVIRAAHITELRTRIDALRLRRGLGLFAWYDPALTVGGSPIRAQHIIDLRTALLDVYVAAGLTPATYTDPSLGAGTPMKAAHITEIRAAVVAIE